MAKSKLVFVPYKNGLGGLGTIKQKLTEMGVRYVETKVVGSRYRVRPARDCVVQWGVPTGGKIRQLTTLGEADVSVVPTTTNREQAAQWIVEGSRVVCRTILNGHGGAGIVLANTVEELVDAPLYTKYTKKKREFRIHVVLDNQNNIVGHTVREKRRRADWQDMGEQFNKFIRNHDNGWIFAATLREEMPVGVVDTAVAAVCALGLKMGAVDCGWHPDTGAVVYEVNTAPGCDEVTAQWYADMFKLKMETEQE